MRYRVGPARAVRAFVEPCTARLGRDRPTRSYFTA